MKYISIKICLVIAVLFGGVAGASDLPDCPDREWTGNFPSLDYIEQSENCFGTFNYEDGAKYVGEVREGKRNGQGTFTYVNGDKYVGKFYDGRRYGLGTYTWANGTVKEGIWSDGEFVSTHAEYKQEQLVRQKKKEKYNKIYTACLLDKSSSVDMQVFSVESAVKETCKSIATKPSWLEKLRYD